MFTAYFASSLSIFVNNVLISFNDSVPMSAAFSSFVSCG